MMNPALDKVTPAIDNEKTSPPEIAVAPALHIPKVFQKQLSGILPPYFQLSQALFSGNTEAVRSATSRVTKYLGEVDMSILSGPSHMVWMKTQSQLSNNLATLSAASNLAAQRQAFGELSKVMVQTITQFGPFGETTVYQMHCSMALKGQGADWLSPQTEIWNPYFGDDMPNCGEMLKTHPQGR